MSALWNYYASINLCVPLFDLPTDTLICVFSWCDSRTLLAIAQVCSDASPILDHLPEACWIGLGVHSICSLFKTFGNLLETIEEQDERGYLTFLELPDVIIKGDVTSTLHAMGETDQELGISSQSRCTLPFLSRLGEVLSKLTLPERKDKEAYLEYGVCVLHELESLMQLEDRFQSIVQARLGDNARTRVHRVMIYLKIMCLVVEQLEKQTAANSAIEELLHDEVDPEYGKKKKKSRQALFKTVWKDFGEVEDNLQEWLDKQYFSDERHRALQMVIDACDFQRKMNPLATQLGSSLFHSDIVIETTEYDHHDTRFPAI